jgi:deoxyribonuclease-4
MKQKQQSKKSLLRFGTGGIPISSKTVIKDNKALSGRLSALYTIEELGLNHIEMEFVYGVRISPQEAKQIKQTAHSKNISVTAHGPYYINLASKDKSKYHASIKRIKKTFKFGQLMGAKSITFHSAFYQNRSSKEVTQYVYKALETIIDQIHSDNTIDTNSSNFTPLISPETTGKQSQWGKLDEILEVATKINQKYANTIISPCIDFAHIFARSNGKTNSYKQFTKILNSVKKSLGQKALSQLHIHISGIEYTQKGEKKHLPIKESDLKYQELLQALKDTNTQGWVTCESPILEQDALLLQNCYQNLNK